MQNHHLVVPFSEIDAVKKLGLSKTPNLHDNLIIEGDNLKALKALLPTYHGKVKCIYIDPPYNTGNEGWVYNDRVNSPMMRDWFNKTVDRDDLTRHDKWCCMMLPRLKLLRELLTDDGAIFVSIDDNEVHHLRALMDGIFGPDNLIREIVWKNKYGPGAMTKGFGSVHEYILCYGRNPLRSIESPLSKEEIEQYTGRDEKFETRGGFVTQPLMTRSKDKRENLIYSIKHQGEKIDPDTQWIWEKDRLLAAIKNKEVVFRKTEGKWSVRFKQYLRDENGKLRKGKPISILNGPFNQEGTWEIEQIFGDKEEFANPKPSALIRRLLTFEINGDDGKDAIVLDSFAGSGTTAHAVLALNKEDGGNRRFILCQMPFETKEQEEKKENICETITAERVRRVIKGVPKAKDETLRQGLGGTFSYFRLGKELRKQAILDGKDLPRYEALAGYVFFTATGEEFDPRKINRDKWFVGTSRDRDVFLIYEEDIEKLKDMALNLDLARKLGKAERKKLVFAPTKYLDQEYLDRLNIEFCQLPFEIYQRATKK